MYFKYYFYEFNTMLINTFIKINKYLLILLNI